MKAASPSTKLVIVERDPDFCRLLRQKFPAQDIVEGDACKLDEILAERGIATADHVISGLPLPSFPAQSAGLDHPDVGEGARGRTASSGRSRTCRGCIGSCTGPYFRDVSFKLVPLNLPPGGVYYCKGYQTAAA